MKDVWLSLNGADARFSDNWLDLHGPAPVTVSLPKSEVPAGLTAADIRRMLKTVYYNPAR